MKKKIYIMVSYHILEQMENEEEDIKEIYFAHVSKYTRFISQEYSFLQYVWILLAVVTASLILLGCIFSIRSAIFSVNSLAGLVS